MTVSDTHVKLSIKCPTENNWVERLVGVKLLHITVEIRSKPHGLDLKYKVCHQRHVTYCKVRLRQKPLRKMFV